jgi:hypothetical protein
MEGSLEANSGKKFSKTPSQFVSQAWWYMPVIPATWEAKDTRSQCKVVRPGPVKNVRPYLKNN